MKTKIDDIGLKFRKIDSAFFRYILSSIFFFFILVNILIVYYNYYEIYYNTSSEFSIEKIKLSNEKDYPLIAHKVYFGGTEIGLKVDNYFFVKEIEVTNIFLLGSICIVVFFSILWMVYISSIIRQAEKDKYLLKTSNLESLAGQSTMIVLSENISHELASPQRVINGKNKKHHKLLIQLINEKIKYDGNDLPPEEFFKVAGKSYKTNDIIEEMDMLETAIEQVKGIVINLSSFKSLKHSNGNKTIFDLIDGASKLLKSTVETPLLFNIDEALKHFKIDHKTGMKNADLINILMNHFKNSVTANASDIWVTIENIRGNEILLNIRDNGNGIPEYILPDLFSPNKSSAEDTLGIRGNGMYINQSLIKMFGGDIRLKSSEKGIGTQFVIKFPAFKTFSS